MAAMVSGIAQPSSAHLGRRIPGRVTEFFAVRGVRVKPLHSIRPDRWRPSEDQVTENPKSMKAIS